jgi:hypothetical protein
VGQFSVGVNTHGGHGDGQFAYFSDRGRWFQRDRGRRFSAIVDALGCAQARV